ncbi:NAD(P)-dependent oxidoreductase [Undibacterium sp. Dicai25W]|uniref:NAD(P)-dependent oxidoreductase n=1 Tax=Undibacterium sp. Dicai25W TaxID=3413034 RepID=UPI003BEF5762
MSKIALLGMGAMGSRMAKALIEAKHTLHIYNVVGNACEPIVAMGAKAFVTPREAAVGVDFVIAMVWDDAASAYVWLDPEIGAMQSLSKGAVAIECATLTVEHEARLMKAAEAQDVEFVSAPMSGSLPEADAKTLIFTTGASKQAFSKVEPILMAMGQKINHAGDPLDGISLKLLINSKLALEYAAMAEMIAFLLASGKDAKRYLEIAASTAPFSARGIREARYMLDGNETSRVKINQLIKDSANHIAHCKTHGVPCHMTEAANLVFRKASAAGFGDLDAVALARIYREQTAQYQAA